MEAAVNTETTETVDSDATAAPAIPEDGVFGDMNLEEINTFEQLQAQVNHSVHQIGLVEIRKSALTAEYHRSMGRLENFMKAVAQRLGVPSDHRFRFNGHTVTSAE